MNQQSSEDTIMEVREDLMLSHAADSDPILRTAHFLKPIANSIDEPPFDFNPSSSSSNVLQPKVWPLKTNFSGWHYPQEKWVCWVDQLQQKYESVWKKAGIFEALMNTKCFIVKNKNLVYGIVEKWCCETNTFVFPFGEATITLEDVMVLGGYPILGDPVFTILEDQEMREVEKKLMVARNELYKSKQGKPRTSIWMDIFIDKGSEIEHEAFLATWLSTFLFPHRRLVKSSMFPIAVYLARGNPIALGPAVLASLYKDLSLFKKTIVDLSKYPVGDDRFPMELTLRSPFYLVQIWVWERFKNLQPQPQPQPMLINHGDPLLFRWHKVKPLQIDNVRLALDSAMDEFLWRPYVRYADKCGVFYPNDEIWVPFKKDLDNEMLSFVTCLRVSELVGFDSIEQYLPHRVAMQFGMDQDVPSHVPRFNEANVIAWRNYCRTISDKNLYFPSRFFEANVTTRYEKWWKQSILGCEDFVKKIVQQRRSESSTKHGTHLDKANRSGIDVGVPPGFPPKLADTLTPFMSIEDCNAVLEEYKCGDIIHKCKQLFNQSSSATSEDFEKILPLKRPVPNDNIGGLEKDLTNANGSKEATMSSDSICLSRNQGESYRFAMRKKVSLSNKVAISQEDVQFDSDIAVKVEPKETVDERDDEVVVMSKEKYLKIEAELARLAKQQEEILLLMNLREKRDEELRQLLTAVLRNQQPPPSS